MNHNYIMKAKIILIGFIGFMLHSASAQENTANIQIKATPLAALPRTLNETSGAISYLDRLWTHNDSGGEPEISAINPFNGNETARIRITNATNTDWEDITQDSMSIYISDTGNNLGNRKEFQVYKINKADIDVNGGFQLLKSKVITFCYPNQPNLLIPYSHNFDCEAIASINGKLFLFTKNWASRSSHIYTIDQEKNVAILEDSIQSNGLITGADYCEDTDRLVLCGYNINLLVFKPFIIDIANFTKPTRTQHLYELPLKEHQVEGVCIHNNQIFITNEETTNIDQQLFPSLIFELELIP